MLADISNVDAIYIVCGRTDMRKSIVSAAKHSVVTAFYILDIL